MAVTWNPKPPEGKVVADRHLFLDKTGNKLVEPNEAASQLAAQGHVLDQSDIDRLGLVVKDGKIVQDHPATIEGLRKVYGAAQAEQKEFAETIDEYKKGNAVNDIPNTMEKARVDLDAKVEAARLNLAQTIKAEAGKDPFKGESQATATEPDKDERKPGKKGKGK